MQVREAIQHWLPMMVQHSGGKAFGRRPRRESKSGRRGGGLDVEPLLLPLLPLLAGGKGDELCPLARPHVEAASAHGTALRQHVGVGEAKLVWHKAKKYRKGSIEGATPMNISQAWAKMAMARMELGVRCTRWKACLSRHHEAEEGDNFSGVWRGELRLRPQNDGLQDQTAGMLDASCIHR